MDAPTESPLKHEMDGEIDNSHNEKPEHDNDLGVAGAEKNWPGWPGESVFRILVPNHKVGGLIGRKGEFIKRICLESGARIKVLDGPSGAPIRAVIISAKEEQDVLISPAMDGLLRVHKRIVDGLDGELNHGPIPGNVVPTRLLVPSTQAGTLIGKHGAKIKSIQEASKSIMRIIDDLPPFALPDDIIIEIQGEPSSMHKALELVAGHLRRFLVDQSVLPLFDMHMSMPPPLDQNMHNMPTPRSWNYPFPLLPPSNVGGPGYEGNPQFLPPRSHDNYYPPPDLPPYEKTSHYGISTYGSDALRPVGVHPSLTNQPPQQMVSQGTHHMQVPLAYADAVIGAAGANISYIRRSSGAAVMIQESRGAPGEMTVEINGTATQIQTAQQLIQNFMAGAGAPASAPPPSHPQSTVGPTDQGYGSYPPPHCPMYGSPVYSDGGYGAAYGGNYGY